MVGTLVKPISGNILQPGHPLARGLDAFWAMNEGGGLVLHNAAGVPYAATPSGTPAWERCSRFPGQALRFDGTDDYFDFGDVLAIRTRDVSMMVLVKLDASQVETYGAIAGRGVLNGGGRGAGFYVSSNKINFQIRYGGSSAYVPGLTSILNTGWRVIVATVDRDATTGLRSYYDGVLQGVADPTAFASADLYSSTERFSIGSTWLQYNLAFQWDFRGAIAAVAQWHRALTASEVAELSRDPFCVLRRRSLLGSTMAAMGSGTPATFKPAWAIRRRQAIGGGIL